MTTRTDWQAQVGRTWAESYHLTDRSFAGLTQRLLERLAEYQGRAVLDIGCGAGELSLAVARARPHAQVIGVDVSADLIATARSRADLQGRVRFVEADAGSWHDPSFAPELLMSRHGVMFFDDPVAAFANLHRQAAPGAGLIFTCFRKARDNPWASELSQLMQLPPPSNPHAPGPFAFAEPERFKPILAAAGWGAIACEPVDFAYVAGMGPDPVADALAFFRRIGPAAGALRALTGQALEEALGRITAWLEDHRDGNLVVFQASAWLVSARKS